MLFELRLNSTTTATGVVMVSFAKTSRRRTQLFRSALILLVNTAGVQSIHYASINCPIKIHCAALQLTDFAWTRRRRQRVPPTMALAY